MADFLTLPQLKAALGIVGDENDDSLALANSTATDLVLDYLSRDPRATDYVERVDGNGLSTLLLDHYPINSVAGVTIGDHPVPADQVDFDANTVFLNPLGRFPRGRRNITVHYNAGHDPLPKVFTQAVIYTVRALLTSAAVDLNSTGESWAGVSSQQWNPGGPGVVPLAAQTLLKGHRRLQSAG